MLLLQAAFGKAMVWLAPVCSTWVSINIGTSKRSLLCPGGDPLLLQNRKANKMASRTSRNTLHECPMPVGPASFAFWRPAWMAPLSLSSLPVPYCSTMATSGRHSKRRAEPAWRRVPFMSASHLLGVESRPVDAAHGWLQSKAYALVFEQRFGPET